jgi:peptide/nickel transport system ATP-binding protein
VAIARALALGPRLLVCDEITSALDVSVQASIIDLLRHLQQTQELTLVFITHNLPLVEMIAQQTAVMTEGQIIEAGPTLRVLREPRADYTARLLADAPKMLDPDAGTRPVSVPVVGGRPQSEPGGAIRG